MKELTSGQLPLTAFRHLEPTGVGIVDLDQAITPRTPDGQEWNSDQQDGVLLVRLHNEPIAIAYIDKPLSTADDEDIATEIWRSARAEIQQHVERFGCAQMPATSATLADWDLLHTGQCPCGEPSQASTSVAVIVPTVGREEQLSRCLNALLSQRLADEIIVVDNRPATGQALRIVTALAANDSRVRYLPEWRPGSSVARNRGVSQTNADVVAFTDDDVVVDPSWLEWLLSPFADPDVTATCGMVLPLELDTEAQKRFERHGGFSKGMERRSYGLGDGRGAGLLYPFLGDLFGSGNSMAFRRKEFVAAGGFDPALGGGTPARSGEDIYAFSTAILRGGRLVYEPRALCWHEHRRDGGSLNSQIFDYGVGLGAIMTKALLSGDRRFFSALARALPSVVRSRRPNPTSTANASSPGTPSKELIRTQRMGMLRGPFRYVSGAVRARKRHFGNVIRGL